METNGKSGAVEGSAKNADARWRGCVSEALASRAASRVKAGWQAGRVKAEECGEAAGEAAASGGQQAMCGIPPIGICAIGASAAGQGMADSGAAALTMRDA